MMTINKYRIGELVVNLKLEQVGYINDISLPTYTWRSLTTGIYQVVNDNTICKINDSRMELCSNKLKDTLAEFHSFGSNNNKERLVGMIMGLEFAIVNFYKIQ